MILQKTVRLFLAGLLILSTGALTAQSSRNRDSQKKNDKKEKESSSLKERLWYGGGFSLNFYGYNGGNVFTVGVAPMVGYKIIEQVSVGPRVSFIYSSLKYPGYKALGLTDTEVGAFVRARVFRGFFVQAEIANQWTQEPDNDRAPVNNRIFKESFQRINQYLGAGYNFGNGEGGVGSEIGIYYNLAVANDINGYANPLGFRLGFTWNF